MEELLEMLRVVGGGVERSGEGDEEVERGRSDGRE